MNLLRPFPALRNLRHLHLSLATTAHHLLTCLGNLKSVRHLRLTYVAVVPDRAGCSNDAGGQWEAILAWVAGHLELDHLEMKALEDIYQQSPRLLLCLEDPI